MYGVILTKYGGVMRDWALEGATANIMKNGTYACFGALPIDIMRDES